MNQANASHIEMPARASHLWLKREDDLLFNVCMGMHEDVSVLELASRMSRCPMDVAQRILEGDLPEMLGFQADPGSEEEAEFLGLALSGVPLQASLRWCTASEGRPTSRELEAMMVGPDMRPAFSVACPAGVWLSGMVNTQALMFLANQPLGDVVAAVQSAIDRFDVPTPTVVAQQILGLFSEAKPVNDPWSGNVACPALSISRARAAKTGRSKKGGEAGGRTRKFSSDAARKKYWAKRNARKKSAA